MRKKIVAVLIAAMTVSAIAPVYAADADVCEEEVAVVETADVVAAEDDAEVAEEAAYVVEAEAEAEAEEVAVAEKAVASVKTVSLDSVSVDDVIQMGKDNYGAITDTIALTKTPKGKKFVYSISAGSISSDSVLTVAKGASFTIEGADVKKGASDDKKLVAINAKNVVKAKKKTDKAVKVTVEVGGKKHTLSVNVKDIKEVVTKVDLVSGNAVSGNSSAEKPSFKKNKVTVYEGQKFDVTLDTLINIEPVNAEKWDKKGVVKDLKLAIGEDLKYHITGTVTKKGNASVSFLANGKKVAVKIGAKAVKAPKTK